MSGGARAGAGRKSASVRQQQQSNRERLIGHLTDADFQALSAALLRRALDGDVQASRLLLSYAAGSPEAELTVSDAEGGPMRVLVEYVEQPSAGD